MSRVGLIGVTLLSWTGVIGGSNIEVEPAPDDCILAANLARTGHLDNRLSVLTKDADAIKQATDILEGAIGSATDQCSKLSLPKPSDYGAPARWYENDNPDCKRQLQAELSSFLKKTQSYPGPFDNTTPPWDDIVGQSIGRYLSEASTKIGCAVTRGCAKNIQLCVLSLPGTPNSVPFKPEFFKALQARENAGVSFATMTQSDVNTPLPTTSSNGAALPVAGLGLGAVTVAVGASFALIG